MALFKYKAITNDNPIDTLCCSTFNLVSFIEVGEEKFCLPASYEEHENDVKTFQVRDEDVYLFGFPKSGTKWASEMIWLIANDLNYKLAAEQDIEIRCLLLDVLYMGNKERHNYSHTSNEILRNTSSPRFIKCHLPWSLLPEQIISKSKNPKIFVLIRTPEDALISFYHYLKELQYFKGTLEEFAELFLAGRIGATPYSNHVLGFWAQKDCPNVVFIKYSEMKQDLSSVIQKTAKFLNKSLSDEDVAKLVNHLSFDKMKENPKLNGIAIRKFIQSLGVDSKFNHMRKGLLNGYKSEMKPELIEKFKKWKEAHFLKTGLSFD